MTKHTERLMSRASVATMAAFAKEPVSTVPDFAERVDDNPAPSGDRAPVNPIDGLTAEEQAQLDAMQSGAAAEGDNVDHGADAPADGGADAPADGDDDDDPPADAVAAPAADGSAAPRQPPRTISYGRHQKELAKAQKERDDLQAMLDGSRKETAAEREQRVVLNTRTQMLLEVINTKAPAAAAAPAADADPEPNADDDPLGHAIWGNRQLQKRLDAIEKGQTRQQETTAAENEDRQIFDALAGDIQRVIAGDPGRGVAADPTMQDAFVHLRETRFQELGFIYANIDITDPAECAQLSAADQKKLSDSIQQTFHNEQMLVARQSISAGRSPAEVVRNLARARGWAPKAPEAAPAAAAPPARNGNGAVVPAAAPAAPARGSVKDQLDAVRQNLDASRSLSDAGGSPGGSITPQQLADMPPAEFERYYAALKDSGQLDQMMGRPANM